jgi:hypothetical protein
VCWLGLGLMAFSLLVSSCSVLAGLADSLLDVVSSACFSPKSPFSSLATISENILVYDRLHSTTTAHHRLVNSQTANHTSHSRQKRSPRKFPQCQDELILARLVSRPALHDQVRSCKPKHSSSTPLLGRMRQHADLTRSPAISSLAVRLASCTAYCA